ncbi:MAG: Pre-mRNA-splicing factor cef1 [Sarcosagium campestre]|nr:MAG: Pre-mRNA-splicing factor cef1 [Sarcosagium campestre]
MPVVKGGVWTSLEDEVMKSAVSKYGLNQWARVSSLLARKTAKQCKARWSEWLDPGIRKIEWSKEEDEKLLHLAKLMPTQWRTIAPIVGRTATQCLERYQKLLDEAEARENDELGLGGPAGPETSAPSADDVRKLRPGELDPDPESKPARPDTVDLDEDEKEMLSEARARLANTQGKKAKRKARERQLDESRRLAVLQKRRELKNAGINIKIINRKKGQMDYNADIPFEKKAAPGFYDTVAESLQNEKQREAFDPRKRQLQTKRKGDQEEHNEPKRRKGAQDSSSAAFAAAAKAGQMQKVREAEQSSKRRALILPSPQISEDELEEIVKMGMLGERATKIASESENEATRGFVGNYSSINGATPIRTPRAPPQEDHIANEIRNIRALTETQSSILGGENTPLHEGNASTGFDGILPRKQDIATPNPLATPLRQGLSSGTTPMGNPFAGGSTPRQTPRDHFAINQDGTASALQVGSTPRDVKMRQAASGRQLQQGFAALPKPKDTEWELELPEEQQEPSLGQASKVEDAEEVERRNQNYHISMEQAAFKRQTSSIQRALPRPSAIQTEAILAAVQVIQDPIEKAVSEEAAALMINDALSYPLNHGTHPALFRIPEIFDDDDLNQARMEIVLELTTDPSRMAQANLEVIHTARGELPILGDTDINNDRKHGSQLATEETFKVVKNGILRSAEVGSKTEKKLALHLGGYQHRAKTLRQKIVEASDALVRTSTTLDSIRSLQLSEALVMPRRLEELMSEVEFVSRREREIQELFRDRKEELADLMA